MAIWLEEKYIHLLAPRLEGFEKKSQGLYNFRCPLCGDSKKNKKIKRAFFKLYTDDGFYFACFNDTCSIRKKPFGAFLSAYDHQLFEEFNRERIVERYSKPASDRPAKREPTKAYAKPVNPQASYDLRGTPLVHLVKVSGLPVNHPAVQYVNKRLIPPSVHWKMFYCPDFSAWVNSFMPEKLSLKVKETRLVFPLFDQDKNFFGVQGRALDPAARVRYITIIADKSRPSVFGLDTVNMEKEFFVLEGPVDSFFVDNSVAQLGSGAGDLWNGNEVFVFDNQPRHPDIMHIYAKKIEAGKKVFIWPDYIRSKDVNECVMNHEVAHADIMKMLRENTFQGLEAQLRFADWKKV